MTERATSVPRTRLSRMTQLGSMAGKMAGNALVSGSRQWLKGERPSLQQLLMTPQNAREVADRLSRMRGAAMKVGQMISMDAGGVIPEELSTLLERLRAEADRMPPSQLMSVLEQEWGADWSQAFSRFSFEPCAAASIGQVHQAQLKSGAHLAIKVQYPGVRESIDSDIANVHGLLKLSGLIPSHLDLAPLIEEARCQLHTEADYRQEGQHLQDYSALVRQYLSHEHFVVPAFCEQHSTERILAMSWQQGQPLLDHLRSAPSEGSRIMSHLFELFFAELLLFHQVQTDPNLANYLYDRDRQQLVLLDLGALRRYSPEFVRGYSRALQAARDQQRDALYLSLVELGFFQGSEGAAADETGAQAINRDAVLDIFIMAAEPLRTRGTYDFAASDLAARIHQRGMEVSAHPEAWHTPPPEVLFLHRKMAGLYLMAAKISAQVDVAALFDAGLDRMQAITSDSPA